MSMKQRLEKSAKTISRFSRLLGNLGKVIFSISNANVYFNVIDDTSYTLEIRDVGTALTEGKTEPTTLELIGTRENFLEILQGKISFATAWVNGKIKLKGVRKNLMPALLMGMILGGI